MSFGQTPYTVIQERFNLIKVMEQPGNMICGPYTEIELWIIDHEGKIIYNNTIATDRNDGSYPLEAEYCRYMKLQNNYMLYQRHIAMNSYSPNNSGYTL